MDRATGRSRGFGFVEMSTSEQAEKATQAMNGALLEGRPLTVNEARERAPRGAGGPGGFRSGPPGGDRGGFRGGAGGDRGGFRDGGPPGGPGGFRDGGAGGFDRGGPDRGNDRRRERDRSDREDGGRGGRGGGRDRW